MDISCQNKQLERASLQLEVLHSERGVVRQVHGGDPKSFSVVGGHWAAEAGTQILSRSSLARNRQMCVTTDSKVIARSSDSSAGHHSRAVIGGSVAVAE